MWRRRIADPGRACHRLPLQLAVACGLVLAPSLLRADAVDDVVAARMREMHLPGLALAVVRDGRLVTVRGYGLANVELQVPVTPDTVFEIGSNTKQLTAAAVMMLVEEGKVRLDDDVRAYLPAMPADWGAVTVRHLLTHTSGIQNYLEVPGLEEAAERAGTTHADVARLLFARLHSDFAPGETWSYSNSGYLLLGNLIEAVSGASYEDFLARRIFGPLGMASTRSSEPAAIIAGRAAGYQWNAGRLENRPALSANAYAAGAVVSTVGDLARWDGALYGERLLSRDSREQMWTPERLAGGLTPPFDYGFGWFLDSFHGHRLVSHSGGTPGFSSLIYRFLDDGLTVIVLSNHGDRVIDHLAIDLAGIYLPALARPAVPAADPDPALSARVGKVLLGIFAGKPDAGAVTSALRRSLATSTGSGLGPWVAADGAVAELTYSETERVGERRILRYRVVFGATPQWCSATVEPDGKVSQVHWW